MKLTVPVIGILRGVTLSLFRKIVHAAFEAGLQAIEITMNTLDAENVLSAVRPEMPEGKWLGMGTVRNRDEAERAVGAGAMFIVTPNTDEEVIAYSQSKGVPVISGAFTPTEVYSAWSAGAQMVKVFPANAMGPRYIRDLLGPFDHIPLVAVGGVTPENMGEYFDSGAAAVAASTALFGREALSGKDMNALAANVRKFLAACPQRP